MQTGSRSLVVFWRSAAVVLQTCLSISFPRMNTSRIDFYREIQRVFSGNFFLAALIIHMCRYHSRPLPLNSAYSSCDSFRTVSESCMPFPVPEDDPFFSPFVNGEPRCIAFIRSVNGQRQLGPRNPLNQVLG